MNDYSIRVIVGFLSSLGLFLSGYLFGVGFYNRKKRKSYDFIFSILLKVKKEEEELQKKNQLLDKMIQQAGVNIDKMESELRCEQQKAIEQIKKKVVDFKEKHGC